ncbi:MAG: hypothetical protein HUU06_02175 [Planctomycetaceae bacterium]|nr:hypothetical protein [Planctomycetota bacterium]NUN51580.1 hypothetical protein [Planctomycetaceae bacterium]
MEQVRSVRVALPAGARTTEEELELLEAAFRAIVDMHYEGGADWKTAWEALERDGWTLHADLCWRVTAQRGHDFESASGRTKADALGQLLRLASLDATEGCP